MTALRADGLVVGFGSTIAVNGVDLVLRAGDLVAVTGSSGAGKSSLLGALGGVHPPAAGSVVYDERPVLDRDDAARRGIVVIPQGNALVRMLSAEENVALPLQVRHQRRARRSANAALVAVGLGDAAGQLVEELSGGQQQRLAIARGLATRGAVVLADEPTSELDATNRAVIMSLLRGESDRGAAVLVATHDDEAADLCDAELRLDDGIGRWIRDDRQPDPARDTRPG